MGDSGTIASRDVLQALLAEIAETFTGFWEVLETILASNPFQDRGDLLGTAVATIAQIIRLRSSFPRHAGPSQARTGPLAWYENSLRETSLDPAHHRDSS